MRTRLVTSIALVALLLAMLPATTSAATIASWKAVLGSPAGYNGYATFTANAAGSGAIRIVAKRLTKKLSYPVEIRSGSCVGKRLFGLSAVKSSSTGTIVKSYTLSASQATLAGASVKLYVRLGAGTRARCGLFTPTIPTGGVSGTTVRVPAGPFGSALHLHTVQAAETWTPPSDGIWQPEPGNVFMTALVKIEAKGSMPYNPFNYRVRDANGLQYGHTIGREPALHSGDLTNGTAVAGWVTFEVPAADATALTLIYNPTYGVTVLVRLTTLPSTPGPAPTPTPTPAACAPSETCLGETVGFGSYTFTANSVSTWSSPSMQPGPGKVFASVLVTQVADASIGAGLPLTFQVSGPSGQPYGGAGANGRTPVFVPANGPGTFFGYLTFEVLPADLTRLTLTLNGSATFRLY